MDLTTTIITTPPQTRSPLLCMPAEIRQILYRILFDGIRIKPRRKKPNFASTPYYWLYLDLPRNFDTLLTCRQIYDEGRHYFYEQATFDLSDMASYGEFFDALSPSVQSCIRTVEGLKITRGIYSQLGPTMKPDADDMSRWLCNFTNLTRMTVFVDTIVTLQDEGLNDMVRTMTTTTTTPSLENNVTFDNVLEAIVSPYTSTGRAKWSLKPLVDLVEAHPNITFGIILKLRIVSSQLRGTKSMDRVFIHLDIREKTVRLAESSFYDGAFATVESETRATPDIRASCRDTTRRIAYTRGGIFAL